MCPDLDLDRKLAAPLIEEYNNGKIPLSEIFYKAKSLIWDNIDSNKSKRKIKFDYYVLGKGFRLKTYSLSRGERLIMEDNDYFTTFKLGNLSCNYSEYYNKKHFHYVSPIENKSSISVDILFNEDNYIEKCYIDFRTHKGNGKVNGLYALRIVPGYREKFTLDYINRKGRKTRYLSAYLPVNLFFALFPADCTLELVDKIIDETIVTMNQRANLKKLQKINFKNEGIATNFPVVEKQVIDFIKQIKGEIPLPHLRENIEKFVESNSKYKLDCKIKTLKK